MKFFLALIVAVSLCGRTVSAGLLVEPKHRGLDVDALVEETLGAVRPRTTCDIAQGTCPEYALVWATGSFVEHFTPGALMHGGLKLRLSLCCNYTFKKPFAAGSSAPRFDDFIRTLVRQLPDPVQELAPILFDISRMKASFDFRAIELTTAPVTLESANRAVQSLVAHAAKAGLPVQNDDDEDTRPWNLLVANFVLDCKCPHTLRVQPLLHAHRDAVPTNITLDVARSSCFESGSEAPSSIDVSVPVGALLPHAQVTWSVHSLSNPKEVHQIQNAFGVKLRGAEESVQYSVTAAISYGGAASTVTTNVGWSFQAHMAFENSLFRVSDTEPRRYTVTLKNEIQIPFSTRFDLLKCNSTHCDDPTATMERLTKSFQCNRPYRLINASLVEIYGLGASATGTNIKCRVADPIRVCPEAGHGVMVNSVLPVVSGELERVVCSPNTTLTASVVGLPSSLKVEDSVTVAWACREPHKAASSALHATSNSNTVLVDIPASGLLCTYTVTPLASMAPFFLPWDASRLTGASAVVKLSSSYAQFEGLHIEPIRMTTKTRSRTIEAPTRSGKWVLDHPKLNITDSKSSVTTLVGKSMAEAFTSSAVWINQVPPCIGHEFNIPIMVSLAPPETIDFCDHMWYNDLCRQVSAKYPQPDEQGEFTVDNSTGLVPSHNLSSLGVNSAILCDAPDGSKVPITWRVWNAAGSLQRTCVFQRCSKIPTPQMAPRMQQTIVMGSRMQVEVLQNFDAKRFRGTWKASSPVVKFDDPHALHTTARGLPPGRTTISFTLDAIGEEGRPEDFCPTRTVLVHVVSEAALCPSVPLHTCSENIVTPFFQMAPKADREKQPTANATDFVIACQDPVVKAHVDAETGDLHITGIPVGSQLNCTVTAAYSEFSEQHCSFHISHVHRSPPPQLALEPFWVGAGIVPASVRIRVAHGRAPGKIEWKIESRNLDQVSQDEVKTFTTPLESIDDQPEGWPVYEASVPVTVTGESKSTITATHVDELCGAQTVEAHIQSFLAHVSSHNITTCHHSAPLEGRSVKSITPLIKSNWSIVANDTQEPFLKRAALPWVMPLPAVERPEQPHTALNFLHYGTYTLRYTLYLAHRPDVNHSVNVTVHALSRNIPPHNSTIFTTQSKFSMFVAPEATSLSLVSASGFRPLQPPTAIKLDPPGMYLIGRLYRGFYKLNYHPRPISGREVDVCPPSIRRLSMHQAHIRRVALRVVAQWDRSVSECDIIRGEAAITLRLMIAFPNGSYAPAPHGLEFAVEGQQIRKVLAELNPTLWWLSNDVEWTVTPLLGSTEAYPIDAKHNLHVLPAEPAAAAVHSSRYQTVRVNLRTKRFFSPEELHTPSFQNLRFPAAAIVGLTESVDPEARMTAMIRVVQLNGTSIYVLDGDSTAVRRFTDEDVAVGRLITELSMKKVVVATSSGSTTVDEGVGGFITASHFMCNSSSLAEWIVGFPAWLRDVKMAKCETNAQQAAVTLFVQSNATFVTPKPHEVRMLVPKLAICGLAVELPSARRAAPTYTAHDVVDFGKLIVSKTPLTIDQSRSSVLQCILAAEVPPIMSNILGGFVVDDFYGPDSSPSKAWHNMTVTRTDGFHVLADVNAGPTSVAACIASLRPTVSFIARRRFKVRLNPCPDLQLPQHTLPRVGLNFRLDAAVNDGKGIHPLNVVFDIVGSFARLRPLRRNAEGALEAAQEVLEVDLKTGKIVFELSIEGDSWHSSVGSLSTQSHNTLVARGFGLEEDGEDLRTVERRRQGLWFKHSETQGLLRYADEYLLPSHVSRINDTVIHISVPSCEHNTAKCRKIAFSRDDAVHYFVPGIATACPGCLRANPPVVVTPTLGPVSVEVLIDGRWIAMPHDATYQELPTHIALITEGSDWSPFAVSHVTMQVLTIANEERAVYAATQTTGKRLSLTLVTPATANQSTAASRKHLREALMLHAVLQPAAFQPVPSTATALAGGLIFQVPLALAPPLPEGVLPLRLGLALSHGYLAFFALDSVTAAFTGRTHFAPSYSLSRGVGIVCFAILLMAPAKSLLSWLIFAFGWGGVVASRRVTLMTVELFVVHLVLIYLAP